jgi:cell division protein FtsW (lipid II flippase)
VASNERLMRFVPAVLAAVTGVACLVLILAHQPDLPGRFLLFLAVMLAAALAFATPYRWLWVIAFVVLLAGVVLAGFSVGLFYIPTVITAGWVMVRRVEATF